MSRSLSDDAEYPYSPRNPATLAPDDRLMSSFVARRRLLSLWFWRFVLGCSAIAGVVFIAVGIIAYQVSVDRTLVEGLEQRGCRVVRLNHPMLGQVDPVPEFVREWVGNDIWNPVWTVSHHDFSASRDELTADDVKWICAACRRFHDLREFSIDSEYFTCDQIKSWTHLDRLEDVSIGSARLTEADLAVIARMQQLRNLKLRFVKLDGAGIGHLSRLKKLEMLGLTSVEFNGSSTRAVDGFPSLKRFEMFDSPKFSDEAILAFGQLPALEEVIFNQTGVGDRGLEHLIGNGKVNTLIMNESRVTDAGLVLSAKCSEPFSLHLAGSQVTDEGLNSLSGRQISSLVLDKSAITDKGMQTIAEIPGIGYLSLSDTRITGTAVSSWNNAEPLPNLQLDGAALTREGVAALAKARSTQLNLSRTFVGDRELMLFVRSAELVELNVTETKVTAEGIKAFYEARKKRLTALGREETLVLNCEFPEVIEPYLPSIFGSTGISDSLDPSEPLPTPEPN